MNKVYSIDNLLVNKFEFLDKTLKYSKLELRNNHSTYPKGGVSCFADSFVVNGSFVLRMKFSGKNPALRVAAKR